MIAGLVDAGIRKQIPIGRRNRAFETWNVIHALAELERRLASQVDAIRISPAVPPRGRRRIGALASGFSYL